MKAILALAVLFILFIVFTLYACLVVGARADRQMEVMLAAEEEKRRNQNLKTENC